MVADAPADPDVVAVGNALVDRTYVLSNLPEPDGGAFVEEYEERPGGVEANVATVLRGLGRSVGLIARLGDDDVGDRVLADLDEQGIDRRRVRVVPGDVSSYCLVLRNRAGERMIVGGGESTANLRLDADDAGYLSRTDVAFASGYVPAPVLASLVQWRRDGLFSTVAFDLAGGFADLERRGLTRGDLDELLPGIDCFIGNRAAVGSYVGSDEIEAMVEHLRTHGVDRGAVTRGADGALLFDGGEQATVPAVDVDVVDTTGAGDGFSAGLIDAWLLEDEPMERAGRFAAAAAALACTASGARGRVPSRDGVAALLDR